MDTKYVIGFLAVIIVIVGIVAVVTTSVPQSVLASKYDMSGFAQCLKDQGVTFYGAFWCPHCQATKRLFGPDATKLLPYVECSTPDGQSQLPICNEHGIQGYPTWVFPDGSRLNGELSPDPTTAPEGMISLTDLANSSGCSVKNLDGTVAITPAAKATSTTATSTSETTGTTTIGAGSSAARK